MWGWVVGLPQWELSNHKIVTNHKTINILIVRPVTPRVNNWHEKYKVQGFVSVLLMVKSRKEVNADHRAKKKKFKARRGHYIVSVRTECLAGLGHGRL